MLSVETVPPRQALIGLVEASWVSMAIRAMATLRLADHLHDGALLIADLAQATDTDPQALSRLIRALDILDLCTINAEASVELTPAGLELQSCQPGSLHDYALAMTAPWMTRAWEELATSVKTGSPAFPDVHGMSCWAYFGSHPADAATFDGAMTGGSPDRAQVILDHCDLASVETIVDVGGGRGELLATVLAHAPGVRGVLADLPDVLAGAPPVLERAGVSERCTLAAIDFFEGVPAGGDAYILALVIHDWPDDAAVSILENCHRAMTPGSRLWIVEHVVSDAPQPTHVARHVALLDLAMLVLLGSRERTNQQFRDLLERAGFQYVSTRTSDSGFSVIEGIRT